MCVEKTMTERIRVDAWVHGHVQRVGFRWWTRCRALELSLEGYAMNKKDGRVHVVMEGNPADCDALVALLKSGETPGRVDRVIVTTHTATGQYRGFRER